MAQPLVFINYRRTESGWPAEWLAAGLKRMFGGESVFLDIRDVDAGDDFTQVLEDKLGHAAALLVLIGKGWLDVQDGLERRRLDDPSDWVRKEIHFALKNPRCHVIPILLDDAALPEKQELPDDIAGLPDRQFLHIRFENS